ncbi:hypothetical protein EVG20_g5726 [Dentipellis fragilis]|uniref:Uncharacterized protein n=1 Tax=Dentipellis fragilis TaxID=205917 RepID=A0A4Y9YS81_9AGAM|nr:hypothetical protein EVG20_g5726 [Dentipellis fragilis]
MLSGQSSPTSPLFSDHSQAHPTPPFNSVREARRRLRDSFLTSNTGSSSSIYPLDTSTVSGTTDSLPSPRSLVDSFQDNRVSSVDPDDPDGEYDGFDADDVSYRLRLLVNNNYFLPPAHSKPSPLDLAPQNSLTPKKSAKSSAPTFLDLFRVGKSKSKPGTPDANAQSTEDRLPVLRTTSDSTTASGWVTRPHARSLPHTPMSPHIRAQDRAGRVAVVREKMDDLIVAAKQAEHDIKFRAEGRKAVQNAQLDKPDTLDDVIDPTDAVDLPPPSADSPFAVQASAVYGLGIEQSVGAAILADRLPPSSPGIWSLDTDEETWRRALLHEAVGHSLNSSPAPSSRLAATPVAHTSGSSPSARSRRPTVAVTPGVKRNLGQHIMRPESLEQELPSSDQTAREGKAASHPPLPAEPQQSMPRNRKLSSTQSNTFPRRAETPAAHPHALAPAPRKPFLNDARFPGPKPIPRFSTEQTSEGSHSFSSSHIHAMRKTMSSPVLRDMYEVGAHGRGGLTMTPPPARGIPRMASSGFVAGHRRPSQPLHRPADSLTSGSHYSMEEQDEQEHTAYGTPPQSDGGALSRSSMTASLPSRPSVSSYSQPSPTASAFHDALVEGYDGSHTVHHSSSYETIGVQPTPASSRRFHDAMSPPPRVSSSLETMPLYPPSRPPVSRSQLSMSSRPSDDSSELGDSNYVSAAEPMQIIAPEPATPPFPSCSPTPPFLLAERRGRSPALLQLPTSSVSPGIHSAPPPASPIAFFDHIQMQHSAMDELETSDESESEESESEDSGSGRGEEEDASTLYLDAPSRPVSHVTTATPSPRPSFMRLGNHSTPHVSSTSLNESLASNEAYERLRPIANVPPKVTYFKKSKGEQSVSNYGLSSHLSEPESPQDGKAQGSSSRPGGQRPATADAETSRRELGERDESLRRLDGLLIQHMEAERDTLSRITKTARAART